MTIKERSLLERMRDELHGYHVEVVSMAGELKGVSEAVEKIDSDIYGTSGDKKTNPGALADITKLLGSRRRMLLGLKGAWAVLLLVVGAMVKYFLF